MALVAATVPFAMAFLLAETWRAARPGRGACLGATNNWNDAGNWVGGSIPGAADVGDLDATGAKNATYQPEHQRRRDQRHRRLRGAITRRRTDRHRRGIGPQPGGRGIPPVATGSNSAITVNGPFSLNGGAFSSTSGTLGQRRLHRR